MSSLLNSVLVKQYGIELKMFCGFLLLAGICSLESCSGVTGASGGFVSGGSSQSSNATLFVTLRAAALPVDTNLLSFRVNVTGILLTSSIGGSVNVPLNSDLYQADLTRVQSDSVFLGLSTAVPAGTYMNMVVSLSNPLVTYCTQLHGIVGCAPESVTTSSGGAATPIITTAPFPLVLARGQTAGLTVNVNIANALTLNGQTQAITSVNLGAPDIVTAMILPPASSSLPSGSLDFIEDTTGIVSSVNEAAQTVTIQTATKGAITAVAGTSTIVSPNCTTFHLGDTFTCARQGQVASLDTILNKDGTFTLVEYDPLSITAGDWIEGIIGLPPSSSTQFQLVTNDFVLAPADSLIGSNLEIGAPLTVNLISPRPFVVDTKGLVVPNTSFSGSTDASALIPGQTVAAHVVTFSHASSIAPAIAGVDFLYLRFTRVTAIVSSVNVPNTLTMQSFPSFFALTVPIVVQLSNGLPSTNFDGISDASSLVSGHPVSLRALYFGSPTGSAATPTPFSAAKIRVP